MNVHPYSTLLAKEIQCNLTKYLFGFSFSVCTSTIAICLGCKCMASAMHLHSKQKVPLSPQLRIHTSFRSLFVALCAPLRSFGRHQVLCQPNSCKYCKQHAADDFFLALGIIKIGNSEENGVLRWHAMASLHHWETLTRNP